MHLAPNVLLNQPFAPYGVPLLCSVCCLCPNFVRLSFAPRVVPLLCSLCLQAVESCYPVPFGFVVRIICHCLCCVWGRLEWFWWCPDLLMGLHFLLGIQGVSTWMFGHVICSGETRNITLSVEGDFMFDWTLVTILTIPLVNFVEEKFGAFVGISGLSSEITKNTLGTADVMTRNDVADGESDVISWMEVFAFSSIVDASNRRTDRFVLRRASHWGFNSIFDSSLFRFLGRSIVFVLRFFWPVFLLFGLVVFLLGLACCFGSWWLFVCWGFYFSKAFWLLFSLVGHC